MDTSLIDRLALDGEPIATNEPQACAKRRERFVRMPLPWISLAARLPGRVCQVAIALWYLTGVKRVTTVKLSANLCRQFGVDRHAVRRALQQLESAHLVSVVRKPGQLPLVTVLPVLFGEDIQ